MTGPVESFLRQVDRDPAAAAIVDGVDRWSYQRLADAGALLAARLDRAGVVPGSLVGLSVPRGWRVVAGILGIWLRGCAYVPIDPEYPARRREYILADAGVSTVVTDGPDGGFAVVPRDPEPRDLPGGLAYVVYTSGSTGEPKGVLVRHANLQALLASAATELPAGPDDVGTVFHSYCFDFSVWEIWRVLAAGGCCVFVPAEDRTDPERFARLLAAQRVTLLNLVPSVFGNLVRAGPVPLPNLREVILGGEAVDLDAVRAWFRQGVAPRARLINMYGITETTVHVTVKPLDPDQVAAFAGPGTPIGRPLPHLRVAVRGDDGAEVAAGAAGEMYVAGAGVAAGYLGRPELTAERFIGGEWYRTGDLARRDADGELVYLGRRDGQIQLRGHRIEPGEVEAALRELPDVAAAGVAVVANRDGEPVLAACYVPADPGTAPQVPLGAGPDPRPAARLRAELRERLPEYMVPTRLVPVDRLPVTPEGKLDRAALAAAADRVTPSGRWQTLVAELWAEVLGYAPAELSAADDFFDLGGHSLTAGRVASRLSRRTGAAVPVRLLFDHPVLADLAAAVAAIAGPPLADGDDRRAKAN